MTNIAILCLSKDTQIEKNIVEKVSTVKDIKLFVYSKDRYESGVHGEVEHIEIPAGSDTIAKMHNFIVKDQHAKGFDGMLHVVEDAVSIEKDLTRFICDLRSMMLTIGMDVWLNTVCDGMNYVYSKYNPRMVVEFDDPKWQVFGFDGMVYTSHSNAAWIVYNMAKYSETAFLFDEQFSARMFMIIEFLARRKTLNAGKNSLCLMNMYPTVKSENGTFKMCTSYNEDVPADVMKEENERFTAMNLNIAPDNLIDNVLESMYNIFEEKLKKED